VCACRYTSDGQSETDIDGFGLSVYDGVNKLSKHIAVYLSTLLATPDTLQLTEGRHAVVTIDNLLTPEYISDGQSYTFNVVLAPVDIAIIVDGTERSTFTSQQV